MSKVCLKPGDKVRWNPAHGVFILEDHVVLTVEQVRNDGKVDVVLNPKDDGRADFRSTIRPEALIPVEYVNG